MEPTSSGKARFIDLSHTVRAGMVTYPGMPGPELSDHLSREDSEAHYAPGTSFQIGRIEMIANTGTYIDSPFHRFEDGVDLAGLPLSSLAELEGVVVRCADRPERAIGAECFEGVELEDRAVLVHTGWARHWDTPEYGSGYPYLDAGAADLLAGAKVALLGIDALNVDDDRDGTRPVHTRLLRAGIPIVEHMTRLDQLPDRGFRLHAVPVKVAGFGSFPVRAYAVVG